MMGESSKDRPVSLRDTLVGKAICSDSSVEELMVAALKHYNSGGDFGMKDPDTGETFVHVVVSNPQVFSRADRVGFLYLLCCKAVDLDAPDNTGETALHKAVRIRGTRRMITCLIRCGADPEVKNREGKTAEDVLRTEQPDGWEENLHWLQKFLPGIWRAVLTDEPDLQLVERLLRSWCRLSKTVNGEVIWLKCRAHKRDCSLRTIMLLEKYENTVELALAMLSGKKCFIEQWQKEGIVKNIDVNFKDYSYQYGYPDYPVTPIPLLAAVWETNNRDMVSQLISLGPDTNVPFKFEPEAHHRGKPLFFYLFDPKLRPKDESIAKLILEVSDLRERNPMGQTVLFEAALHDASEALFSFLLHQGINVAARDRYGRTARDYCKELGKTHYVKLIDDYVTSLVADCNISHLEELVLQGYDHVTDVHTKKQQNAVQAKGSKQLQELLKDAEKKQEHVKKMFCMVIKGCPWEVRKLMSKKYACAQDRGGRTALHHAIEHKHRKVVEYITNEFPQIINIPNNMGQTPLHYAHLFMYQDNTADFLKQKGACIEVKDVEGWTPMDYVRETIGKQSHDLLQQRVRDMELDLFLSATNFDAVFLQAIREGDAQRVEALAIRLRDHGGMQRFNKVLFDCLDYGHEDMACTLIKLGFSTDIYKQYELCNPDNPMCAMMECSHSTTLFRQHAEQVGAKKVLQLMDDIAKGKAEKICSQIQDRWKLGQALKEKHQLLPTGKMLAAFTSGLSNTVLGGAFEFHGYRIVC